MKGVVLVYALAQCHLYIDTEFYNTIAPAEYCCVELERDKYWIELVNTSNANTLDIDISIEDEYPCVICADFEHDHIFKISKKYESIDYLGGNRWLVQLNDRLGLLGNFGQKVTPIKYEAIELFTENTFKVKFHGFWGIIDAQGNEMVLCKYAYIDTLCNGFAKVKVDDLWGYIDIEGREVVPIKYRYIGEFNGGWAQFNTAGWENFYWKDAEDYISWGYVNQKGEEWDLKGKTACGILHENCIRVREEIKGEWKYGIVDTDGNVVVPVRYDFVGEKFDEGVIPVKQGNLFGLVNRSGEEITPLKYRHIGGFYKSNGYLAKVNIGGLRAGVIDDAWKCDTDDMLDSDSPIEKECFGKWGYINRKGQEIIPPEYQYLSIRYKYYSSSGWSVGSEQWIYVEKDRLCGFLDMQGNIIVPILYEELSVGIEGFIKAKQNGLWGFIDMDGNEKIPFIFSEVSDFFKGTCSVKYKDEDRFINDKGEFIEPQSYGYVGAYSDGMAIVRAGMKYGAINKERALVVPLTYDWMSDFKDGLSIVNIGGQIDVEDWDGNDWNGKYGVVDKMGKIIIPIEYDCFDVFETSKYYIVNKGGTHQSGYPWPIVHGGKWGVFRKDGGQVLPIQYGGIMPCSEGLFAVNDIGRTIFIHYYECFGTGSRWGFVDEGGQMVIEPKYALVREFHEGLAAVTEHGDPVEHGGCWYATWGYIDKSGRYVIPPKYDEAHSFEQGYAKVSEKGERFQINKYGERVKEGWD